MSRPPRTAAGRPPAPLRALLRFPLFWKILIANVGIVILGVAVGTAITAEFVRGDPGRSLAELVGLLALSGVVLSALVNALILRLALSPIALLERTARAVQAGDFDARAPISPLADRSLERLTRTFNAMLDGLTGYRERLREMAARALRAEEEERKRIARELHDETAQSLAALLIRLRLVRGAAEPERRDALLEEARAELTRTLEGIRRYARGLRPPALDELGLVPAIEAHARSVADATGLAVSVDAERVGRLLSPEAELALYRMTQEALSNVARHAHASEARIALRRVDHDVVVTIEDDGRGFPVAAVLGGAGGGLGLFGMRERAAYVGGEVRIDSEPDAGTRVRIRIPINERESYA